MKNTKQEQNTFDKRIQSSKFDFCRSLRWTAVIPVVIIIIGIVLAFTIGFNFDSSVRGYTSFKVAANTYGTVQGADKYDLEKENEFDKLTGLISTTLHKNGYKADTFTKTTMNIGHELAEPAVEVRFNYVGSEDDEQTQEVLTEIRSQLQSLFGQEGVTQLQVSHPYYENNTFMLCLIGALTALVLAFAYIAIRFDLAAAFAAILGTFHDLLIMLSLVLVCRIPLGIEFTAIILAAILLSLFNHIMALGRIRENSKSGVYERENGESAQAFNARIANASVKETLMRTILSSTVVVGLLLLLIAFGAAKLQLFALPLVFAAIATFFSSVFLTPALWSISFRPRKKKIAK